MELQEDIAITVNEPSLCFPVIASTITSNDRGIEISQVDTHPNRGYNHHVHHEPEQCLLPEFARECEQSHGRYESNQAHTLFLDINTSVQFQNSNGAEIPCPPQILNILPNPLLCDFCWSVLDNLELEIAEDVVARDAGRREPTFIHHETISQLETSANAGCLICTIFMRSVPRPKLNELRTSKEIKRVGGFVKVTGCPSCLDEAFCPVLELDWVVGARRFREYEYKAQGILPLEAMELHPPGHPSSSLLSDDPKESIDGRIDIKSKARMRVLGPDTPEEVALDEADDNTIKIAELLPIILLPQTEVSDLAINTDLWRLLRKWVNECCSSHRFCIAPNNFIAPTRLLHLSHDKIRLCTSSNLSPKPRYATLSHCWGSLETLRLSKANLTAFQDAVPYNELCKTFQDAIIITKELGLSFLWIDSLCIIQDDVDDRERECALMYDVYSSSAVNIAASDAADGSGGCYINREIKDYASGLVSVASCGETKNFSCIERDSYEFFVSECRLAQRGWALQERILAPRTIHFGEQQLFWECRSKIACETLPDGLPNCAQSRRNLFQRGDSLPLLWPKVIELYSKCHLTYREDKLRAIAGIARSTQSQNNDEYLAGLWRRDLESQLCWRASPFESSPPLQPRPSIYLAPTWSWASIESLIEPAK